ncbi:DUF2267 domain-containing protein [Myxococcaceae bacterium GXIMD 01537]
MARPTNESELKDRRELRHEAHVQKTYGTFIKHLCQLGSMDREMAECAAVAVLTALERRLPADEAKDLEAQLPRRLVEFLPPPDKRPPRPRKFGRGDFVQTVAEDLRRPPEEAERLTRLVFQALRDQISEGEARDVESNLPLDLQALWRLTQ